MENLEREARREAIAIYLDKEVMESVATGLSLEDVALIAAGRCYDLYRGFGSPCSLGHAQGEAEAALYRVLSAQGQWNESAYADICMAFNYANAW